MKNAEKSVADYVISDPQRMLNLTMAELAEASGVSDPTIVRFFRKLGFDGFNEFKIRLAQDLVPAAPFAYESINQHDNVAEVVSKTCRNSINAIQRALGDFNIQEMEIANNVLLQANWVIIAAAGLTEIVALEAEHKFSRIGIRCRAVTRLSLQTILSKSLKKGDLLMIFSQSGTTRHLIELAHHANASGGQAMTITAPNSPLALASQYTIGIQPYEQVEVMTPLSSRLNHQIVVNILTTTMAMTLGVQFPDQLSAMYSWIQDKV